MSAGELSKRKELMLSLLEPAKAREFMYLSVKLMAFDFCGYVPWITSKSGLAEFTFRAGTYEEVKKALRGMTTLPMSFIGSHGVYDILPDVMHTDKNGRYARLGAQIGGHYYLRMEVAKNFVQSSWLVFYIRMKDRPGKVRIYLADNPVVSTRVNKCLVVTNHAPDDFPYLVPCGTRYGMIPARNTYMTLYNYAGVKPRNKEDKAFQSIVKNNRRVRAL